MELLKAILLGFIQGATEFLPVSSSGHLVLGSHILGFEEQGLVFDVMLHLGTLAAVVVVFRDELLAMVLAPFRWSHGNRVEQVRHFLLWDIYIIIATIPAVIVGFSLKERFEVLFDSILLVCLMLVITGSMMIATKYISDTGKKITGIRAFIIGCAQACAILPGLSRSGSTIFCGMLLGINRETVARFSFIMSIPAILGAAILNVADVISNPPGVQAMLNLSAGTITSALTGYFAIVLLLDLIKKNRLSWFGYYCLAIAGVGLSLLIFTS
ncbi:MAG: undecaprenyl-diphosphate phosphatase [Deltaproteobacteria bacterium]|nr:undecaprenyl-diphosphate phosphatase [Deltaproteobacteria bacterium]